MRIVIDTNIIASAVFFGGNPRKIIECVKRNVGTIVIGKNTRWKTKAGMSKKSNQEFVQIPHCTLIHMIRYKAEREGIRVLVQEESYTSKASFLGKDEIPVCGKNDKDARFTGKRIHRGLYKTDDGTVINADMNGSANIMRKCIPDAFRLKELAYDRMIVIKHPMYNAMVSNRNKQKNK